MEVKAIQTRIFKENENLLSFILDYIHHISSQNLENSVLVITSKIVALSEGRVTEYTSEKQKIALIKKESDWAIKTKIVWMTIKDGMVLASAGIDESNANGKLILLPRDSFKTAALIHKKICKIFKLKNFGIIITDSRLMPLRTGALGVALGFAGFEGVRSYVGTKDIFGRVMKISKTNVADSLATAAVLCMGEGREQRPLTLITDTPVLFSKRTNKNKIIISPEEDIYAPFFKGLKLKNKNAKKK